MWVVIRKDFLGTYVHGPYATRAFASGRGFSLYGPIGIGNVWSIREVKP